MTNSWLEVTGCFSVVLHTYINNHKHS